MRVVHPDDEDDDREEPYPHGVVDHPGAEDPDLTPCPACRRMLSSYAMRCHHCGRQFDREVWQIPPGDVFGVGIPGWAWLGGAAALAAFLWLLLRR